MYTHSCRIIPHFIPHGITQRNLSKQGKEGKKCSKIHKAGIKWICKMSVTHPQREKSGNVTVITSSGA